MKKQPEVTEKTRQVFVDVFCDLYCKKPIEKISIQEITNKAGYNRSTFYQYFSDIYELLAFVENDVLDYISPKDNRGEAEISDLVALYDEKGTYLNALLGDFGSNRFVERLKACVPLEDKNISLSENNQLTPYLYEFHISTVLSLFRLWQRRGKDIPLNELLALIIKLVRVEQMY